MRIRLPQARPIWPQLPPELLRRSTENAMRGPAFAEATAGTAHFARLRRARPASPGYGERGPLRPSLQRVRPTSPRLGRGYGGHGQISPGYGGHPSGPASRPNRERSSVWCSRAILARFARAKTQLRSGLGPWGRTIASPSVSSSRCPGKDCPATPDPRESGRAKSDGVIPRKSSRRRPPAASGSERAKIP